MSLKKFKEVGIGAFYLGRVVVSGDDVGHVVGFRPDLAEKDNEKRLVKIRVRFPDQREFDIHPDDLEVL